MSLLEVDALHAHHGLLHAVRGVDLRVAEGDALAIVGANGAGKTTLLRTIAGAHRLTSGRVVFDGGDVGALRAHARVGLGIALVPEGRRLFPGLTVEENLLAAGAVGRPGRWTLDEVMVAFPQLQRLRGVRAANLSGGEQQATAIARALMTNPRVLLLDEASLGLSPVAVEGVYRSLRQLVAEGTTIVLVEQDLGRALSIASRVVCMLEGRVTLSGKAGEVTTDRIKEAYFGLRRANGRKAEVS